ncbi:MAG: ATP-binding protein [Gallionella sp.]|jgi:PAS domain S-box-containing protein|nr:ATP-binding protein [Gallionella sp.]MCK9352555.1 ATP-binding protein [Gallionella sp.]
MSSDVKTHIPDLMASSAAFGRWLVAGVALINIFVFGVVAFTLHQSHAEFGGRAEVTAQNLSLMLAHDIGREFEKIDVTLLSAADEFERQLAQGDIDRQFLNASLTRLQRRVPEIISMRATDAAGFVSYGLGVNPDARLNNSDREYYTRQRDDPEAGLVVSKPVFARIDKLWVVPISRAIHRQDGSFAGVVYVNVSLAHLAKVFSSFDVGLRGSVSLRDAELRIYARHPVPVDADKVLGQTLDVPELREMVRSGLEAKTYISSHTVDGVERKFAVHKIPAYPLYAVVGRATDEYMAPWRAQAVKMLALTAFFSLVTLLLSWMIYRIWRRQMAATMELAREEEKFHTVADYTYDWEYWEGGDGKMLFMSPSCERMTGYASSEFLSDPGLLLRIVHTDDQRLMQSHRHDVGHQDESAVDFRILRKDGEIRWIAHGCRSVFGRDGQFMGRRVSNHDITERKAAEAALSRFNAELEQRVSQRTAELETAIYDLENFNYSASHDLRIPLRAIDGFSKILLDEHAGQLDDEAKRLLKIVRNNTVRMSQYIDDMLTFSRTGRKALAPEEIDMEELVREVMEEIKPDGAEIELDIRSLPHTVADRAMMRQVFVCLLSNAIKFSRPRKPPRIQVGASIEGGEIIYYVKDNGVGFDMRYVGKLFGVFERLHSVTEFEGNGIGLAIFKRIVSRHGGRVWAEGKVDEGATVYFALPIKENDHG